MRNLLYVREHEDNSHVGLDDVGPSIVEGKVNDECVKDNLDFYD